MIDLKEVLNKLKVELKGGLISSHIWSNREGRIIAGYNFFQKVDDSLSFLTKMIKDIIKKNNFPELSEYYLVNLENDQKLIVIMHGNYEWYNLVDTKQTSMGLIFNMMIPYTLEILKNLK